MSKMTNHWEIPISTIIPYLQWAELTGREINFWKTGRHNHASYELHIILSGQCDLFINNTKLTLQAGQGILIAPEVFHAPGLVAQPFRRLSAAFFPNEVQLFQLIPEQGSFLTFSANQAIQDLCSTIFSEVKNKDSLLHEELLANLFAQLMLRILRAMKESTPALHESVPKAKQFEDMAVIDKFFVDTPPKSRTRGNLAKLLHCSERQALRKLYALYGMSFQQKQMISRIDTAQHLLRVTEKSIAEICSYVGYSDTAAFYKAFKFYTNTTPMKYRKRVNATGNS